MFNQLHVYHLPAGQLPGYVLPSETFVLQTCQRSLLILFGNETNVKIENPNESLKSIEGALSQLPSYELYRDQSAYKFLLETISGLKSEIIGEYEVVGQFKKAYQEYVKLANRSPKIMKVLEKLFQDSKEIRTLYLNEIGQLSYGGIAKKILHEHVLKLTQDGLLTTKPEVTIIGTGQLATDLVKLFTKKYPIVIVGRNKEKLESLRENFPENARSFPITDDHHLSQFVANQNFIINTVGTGEILFDEDFFSDWALKFPMGIFVDLGSPSSIFSALNVKNGLWRLEDLFDMGNKLSEKNHWKINKAYEHISTIVTKRTSTSIDPITNLQKSGTR